MKILHVIVAFVLAAVRAITPTVPRTPVVTKFNENHWARRRYGKAIAGGNSGGFVVAMARALLGLLTPRTLALTAAVLTLVLIPDGSLAALLASPVVLAPETLQKKAQHDKLAGELFDIQEKYRGKEMPQNVGEDFEAKCQEAESIWAEIGPEIKRAEAEAKVRERHGRMADLERVPDPTMPGTKATPEVRAYAGAMTLGDFVIAQKQIQEATANGWRGSAQIADIPFSMKHGLVLLTKEQRHAVEEMESKTLLSLGTGVINPERLDVIAQTTGDDKLRLRDLFPTSTTMSNAVEYYQETHTRAAAETTPGSAKPEGALAYTLQTSNVRTIPVWTPVTTDQLADWPQLRGRIDNRLMYDIDKRLEEQLVYGDGTAPNLSGLLDVSGTTDVTADAQYTGANDELEHIRLGSTLVMVAGYEPNGLLIHPRDWFATVVLKGTDDHYLGQVFMTADRQPRVWGLTVVESIAAEENSGVATPQRNWIVGDFQRGAEIVDRMRTQISIGLNSDDFTKNKRTILAECRVAFPIYAPAAFAYKQTQAEAT